MSEAATGDDDDDEIVTVNFKATESFVSWIDDTWQGRGFNSRSEFIRLRFVMPSNFRPSIETNLSRS